MSQHFPARNGLLSCLRIATALIASAGCSTLACAADVTYKASGVINSPSPIAGESMTVFYTFDTGTPVSSIGGDCSANGRGYVPVSGFLYPESIKSVTYSIGDTPPVSLGSINNLSENGASEICLASDEATSLPDDQFGFANVYDVQATGITGYYMDVNLTAESGKRIVIVPASELITDRPNFTLFERDLNDEKVAGSAMIYIIDPTGHAVGGAPATLTSVVEVEGLIGPAVVPSVAGTMGSNGWYVTRPTTLSWGVSGKPTPVKSGCGKVTIPDTTGTNYTCSASNEVGDASDTVLIKKDSTAPAIQLKAPMDGAKYPQNHVMASSYTCTDATSGVASCTGSVTDGANIPTGTLGTSTFSVTATDNAGNTITKSITYDVDVPAATPVFSLKTGTYKGAQSVTISETTPGATVYYTLDGSTPTKASTAYGSAVSITKTETLKAIAEAPTTATSAVRTAAYTIN